MKLEVSKGRLVDGLSILDKVNNSMSINTYKGVVAFQLTKEGVYLFSTNLAIYLRYKLSDEVLEEESTFLVKSNNILNIIKGLKEDIVVLDFKDDGLVIDRVNGKYKFRYLNIDYDFDMNIDEKLEFYAIDGKKFARAMMDIALNSKTSGYMPQYSLGVLLRSSEDKNIKGINVVASDGFLLKLTKIEGDFSQHIDAMIPNNSISIITRILLNSENVLMGLTENQFIFKTDNWDVICVKLSVNFPDYKSILEKSLSGNNVVKVGINSLIDILNRMQWISSDDTVVIELEKNNKDNEILIKTKGDNGEAIERLEVEKNAKEDISVKVGIKNFLKILKGMSDMYMIVNRDVVAVRDGRIIGLISTVKEEEGEEE